jgi:hypothetical protein
MRSFFDMPLWAFCTALLLLFYGAMGLGTALGETRPPVAERPQAAAAPQPPSAAMVPPGTVRNPAVTPPAPFEARPLDASAVSVSRPPIDATRPPQLIDASQYPPVPMPQPVDPGAMTILPVPIEPPGTPGTVPGAPPRS